MATVEAIVWSKLEDSNNMQATALTGVSIWMLSVKFPMKAMMVIFCMSLSILLNCIMKRSSSVRLSSGFRSFSNCRSTFTSVSVGWKRIRHSTKSTGRVRRSKLRRDESTGTSGCDIGNVCLTYRMRNIQVKQKDFHCQFSLEEPTRCLIKLLLLLTTQQHVRRYKHPDVFFIFLYEI